MTNQPPVSGDMMLRTAQCLGETRSRAIESLITMVLCAVFAAVAAVLASVLDSGPLLAGAIGLLGGTVALGVVTLRFVVRMRREGDELAEMLRREHG